MRVDVGVARTWPGAASLSGGVGLSEQGWWAGECQEQDVRDTGAGAPSRVCLPFLRLLPLPS